MKKSETAPTKYNKKMPTIKEARRYVNNAEEILKERGRLDEDGLEYLDDKHP